MTRSGVVHDDPIDVKPDITLLKSQMKKKSASKKKKAPKKTIKKEEWDDRDTSCVTARLREKFTKSKNSKDGVPTLTISLGKRKVYNPIGHDNILTIAEDNQLEKAFRQEQPPETVLTRWVCAFCQQRSGVSVLGFLFGPYYATVTYDNWPEFLAKKPQKGRHGELLTVEVWVHSVCALWTPGVLMKGAQLTGLDYLPIFWSQKCAHCRLGGASVDVAGKHFHYHCALKKGFVLNRKTFSCTLPRRKWLDES